jgi:small subunit ribosomal protein S2
VNNFNRAAVSESSYPVSLIELTFEQLVLVDFHVGNKINNFEKLNYHFIFGRRHKNFLVNLQFTLFNLKSSLFFLTNVVSRRGKVLFLDCAPSNRNLIAFFAKTSRQYFCNHKWISGTLTNFKYFYPAVFEGTSQHFKLSGKSSFGFRFLHRIPNVVCFLDLSANVPAVTEVIRLGIPSLSLVNTDFSISGLTFPIFANSFSVDSFTLFLALLRSSILNGYRFEIYKFFRDSLKRSLAKRLKLAVFTKTFLDDFFFVLKSKLFGFFFQFFSLLIVHILLVYDLYLFSFFRSFFHFFYSLFSKLQIFTIDSFPFSYFFWKSENFFILFQFLNYFFNYFFFKFIIFGDGSLFGFFFIKDFFSVFYIWRIYLRIFFFFNFIYFSKSHIPSSSVIAFFMYSTGLIPKIYFFRFFNRFIRFKNSFKSNSSFNFPIFKSLKSFRLFSKFKSQSFLFFKFKARYRKTLVRMSRFLKSLKVRLRLTSKIRILCWKYLKASSRLFLGPNLVSSSFRRFTEFSIDELVLSEIFEDEGFFSSRDWRLVHMKFRVFFNSLFLLENFNKAKKRGDFNNDFSMVTKRKPSFYIKHNNKLQNCIVYFNFLKFAFKFK